MLFVALKNSFFSELAYFGRKTASVYLKIVRKFLTIKGYIKIRTVCLFGFSHKIGKELVFGCALGGYLYLLVKKDRFYSEVLHKIEYQILMEYAIVFAGVQNMAAIYEHDFARLVCNDRNRKGSDLCAGKGFCKHLTL